VNATTGTLDNSFSVTISNPPAGTTAKVKTLALSPGGAKLAIAGTFLTVNGQSVPRLALINTGGGLGSTTTLDNWSAPILAISCLKQDSYINGIDFSPDSSYFVVAATGYKTAGGPAICDSAVRFEAGATGSNVQPVWENFTGADLAPAPPAAPSSRLPAAPGAVARAGRCPSPRRRRRPVRSTRSYN
jgi:hypothetical protein